MLENAVCLEEARLQLEGVAGIDLPIILSVEGAMRTLDREEDSIPIFTLSMVYMGHSENFDIVPLCLHRQRYRPTDIL